MLTPHVMCAKCQHVFPSEASLEQNTTCPNCAHEGKPARIMKPTGFPSLDVFTKNWQRSKKIVEHELEESNEYYRTYTVDDESLG
ncbi:MAG: hypothetical protein ACRCYY_11825 [Trueperaceae bacterium]